MIVPRRITTLEVGILVILGLLGWTYRFPTHVQSIRDRVFGSPRAIAESDLATLNAALASYHADTGEFPSTAQGLAALRVLPGAPSPWNWRGPYVLRDIPTDPWGSTYVYRAMPASGGTVRYELISLGADRRTGGTGDAMDVVIRR